MRSVIGEYSQQLLDPKEIIKPQWNMTMVRKCDAASTLGPYQ